MAAAKAELRLQIRSIRDAIPADEARRAAEAAARHLLSTDAAKRAAIVALYAPVKSELDTHAAARALAERGVALAFPRVVRHRLRLAFHRVRDLGDLEPGNFGILEPPASAAVVPVERIDLFVVPGLAFDRSGARLGWGKGFYDATLAANPRAARIGYAYECQVVDEIPVGPVDVPMELLVTEAGVHSCHPALGGD